ncbi:hypothetical protein [Virgibacillus litoralis]|nr:hypothetical protein [Virgibacillus litoralis]
MYLKRAFYSSFLIISYLLKNVIYFISNEFNKKGNNQKIKAHQVAGDYYGEISLNYDEPLEVDGLLGCIEEYKAKGEEVSYYH